MAQSDFEQESTANATWSRMLQGNRRFAEGKPDHPWQDKETRQTLLDGQNPDAAVLSCSDSRVPPEIIFDQGLGDLFTVRTAGQLIDSAVIASLEYAVKKLHVSLICVLGHEHCLGSSIVTANKMQACAQRNRARRSFQEHEDIERVHAAEQELDDLMHTITSEADGSLEAADAMDDLDEHIAAAESIILRQAGMSVWQAREAELDAHEDIERVHVAHIIETLVEQSPVIQQALAADKLMIVGARYQLDSGKVEVLSF